MRSRMENINWHLSQMPMLRVLLPIVVGVIIADRVTFPLWSVAVGFVLLLGVAWWLRTRTMADIYLFAALMLLGIMAVELRRGDPALPTEIAEKENVVEIAIDRVTSRREGVVLCDGRVVAYRQSVGEAASQAANFDVRVVADSAVGVQIGSRLVAKVRLRPFNPESENRYEAYMARRGVVGQVWLRDYDVIYHTLLDKRVVRWLHDKALQRLNRLSLDSEGRAVVEAMTIGERASISRSLREEYARSGSAHLLAVSGLHVGFIFAIINLLLLSFALLRHGQLLRVVPAVAAIWLYAAVAGASPSVVRAAVMFTLLQLAFLLSARTHALNSLAFTASVMIIWNSSLIHDVGFLLSFSAVAGIVVFGVPLASWRRVTVRLFERRLVYQSWRRELAQRLLLAAWRALAMSVAASVVTMPLTAYMFGVVSWWSIVVGPLMILLGMATVSVAMVWVLMPIGALEGVVSWVLDLLTRAMNGIAEWCAQSHWLIYEGYMSKGVCEGCYLLIVLFALLLWSRPKGDREHTITL